MQLLTSLAVLGGLAAAIPAQHVLSQCYGPQPSAGFGSVLSSIGDLDGDGVRDLVVGVADYASGTPFPGQGAVEVRSGRTGAVLRRSVGSSPGVRLGQSVAGVGDVDGDGVTDYAAGSPTFNNGQGTVVLFSGSDGRPLFQWYGEARSEFGTAIVGVDDFDHDQRADLGISAPHNSSARAYGQVLFYSLASPGRSHQIAGTNGSRIGASLAAIGDIDGDGRGEVAIGEPGAAYNGSDSGAVRLVDPSRSGNQAVHWEQRAAFLQLDRGGSRVAAAGDIDGDGCPDVMCAGRGVYVLSGRSGAVLLHLQSNDAGFGLEFCGVGDFDGDGRDDFAIAAPGHNLLAGRVYVYSGRSGQAIRTVDGAVGERFGSAIVGLGDVDSDHRADFAVGAPGAQLLGLPLGRVTVHGCDVTAMIAEYGNGCGGADAYHSGRPVLGGSCSVRCGNLHANSFGVWMFGFSDAQFGAAALPLSLQPFGHPGCSLLTSIEATAGFFTGNLTQATWTFPTVTTPMVGHSLYMQAAVVDAAAPGGMAFSDGVALQFGNR